MRLYLLLSLAFLFSCQRVNNHDSENVPSKELPGIEALDSLYELDELTPAKKALDSSTTEAEVFGLTTVPVEIGQCEKCDTQMVLEIGQSIDSMLTQTLYDFLCTFHD